MGLEIQLLNRTKYKQKSIKIYGAGLAPCSFPPAFSPNITPGLEIFVLFFEKEQGFLEYVYINADPHSGSQTWLSLIHPPLGTL